MQNFPFQTIDWTPDGIVILDQTKLPNRTRYLTCQSPECVIDAIKTMAIRGAPAIGVAAAMGLALGAEQISAATKELFLDEFETLCNQFATSRPTAVNLFWAIARMKAVAHKTSFPNIKAALKEEAQKILWEDIDTNRAMGHHGKSLIPSKASILTHCNAGALATGGYGTALGVVYAAAEEGKEIHVYADETRPVLQGARLTTWELHQNKIPVTLITDNMAALLMKDKKIDLVLVGADRIARNGDTANKIGTYGIAVLANYHRIPFYIAAPRSTFDPDLPSGSSIPIEHRNSHEIFYCGKKRIAPRGIHAFNPAFDVTPHSLISGFITEKGILRPPFHKAINQLFRRS